MKINTYSNLNQPVGKIYPKKIPNNYVKQYYGTANIVRDTSSHAAEFTFGKSLCGVTNTQNLPSNLPVSYTKINEFSIPGLDTKASVFKLANGQKIVILPKKGPAFIRTTFNVGAFNETDNIKGISHFIEHNLFNGSKDLLPKQYDQSVSDMGGYTNASTSFDKTDYYMSLQLLDENSLENAISLNANLTQFPSFPVDQLDKEKSPVKSEIDMYKDDIVDVAFGTMLKNLFSVKSDCSNLILGSPQNIDSFSKEQVIDYFNTWYTPDNALTVITGDVDVNKTINLAAKYYNKKFVPSADNKKYYQPINPINSSVRQDIIKQGSDKAAITLGFHIPENVSHKELTALSIISLLMSTPNSSLNKKLDEFGLSAPNFSFENLFNVKNSPKCFYSAIISEEFDVEKIIKILYGELRNLSDIPPDLNALNNAKNIMLSNIQNKIAEYSENINLLLTEICRFDEYDHIQKTINDINSVTPDFIVQTAKKYLDLNKASLCAAHAENTSPQQIINNYKEASSFIPSFGSSNLKNNMINTINSVKTYTLHNNIQTSVIPSSNAVSSALSMSVETDLISSVPKPVFDILEEMLNKGSRVINENTYNDILCSKNINLSFSVSPLGINVNAEFDGDKTSDVISLVKTVLSAPDFDISKFNTIKKNIKNQLISSQKTPNNLIDKVLFPNIRSCDTIEEQIKQIDNISLDDVKNLFNKIMYSSQCLATFTLPIANNPSLNNIVCNNLSFGMPIFQQPIINRKINTGTFKPVLSPVTVCCPQNSLQANIVQAYSFKYSPNISDIAKIKLLNIILGASSMSSRLFTDLRESQKLAYSVGSFLDSQNDTGIINLYVNTSTQSDNNCFDSPQNVSLALQAFQNNVNLLKTQPVSDKELQIAKNKLKTSILNEQEGNSNLNSQLHNIRNSAYGFNYIRELYNAIDNITARDLLNTANYVFRYQPVTAIVAGQNTLNALNLSENILKV